MNDFVELSFLVLKIGGPILGLALRFDFMRIHLDMHLYMSANCICPLHIADIICQFAYMHLVYYMQIYMRSNCFYMCINRIYFPNLHSVCILGKSPQHCWPNTLYLGTYLNPQSPIDVTSSLKSQLYLAAIAYSRGTICRCQMLQTPAVNLFMERWSWFSFIPKNNFWKNIPVTSQQRMRHPESLGWNLSIWYGYF